MTGEHILPIDYWPNGRVGSGPATVWPHTVDVFPTNYVIDIKHIIKNGYSVNCDLCGEELYFSMEEGHKLSHLGYWGSLRCSKCQDDNEGFMRVLRSVDNARREYMRQTAAVMEAKEGRRCFIYLECPSIGELQEFVQQRILAHLHRYITDACGATIVRLRGRNNVIVRSIITPKCVTYNKMYSRIHRPKGIYWKLFNI